MPDDVQPPGPADLLSQLTVTASLDVTPPADVKDGDGG